MCGRTSKRCFFWPVHYPDLMQQEDTEPDVIRSPEEVARRALALFSVVGLAGGAPRSEIVDWLRDESLLGDLTPSERSLIEAASLSQTQLTEATWLCERLVVLCWALGLLDGLPDPDEQWDTEDVEGILPPFADVAVPEFIGRAKLRPETDLIKMADEIQRQHWQARNEKLTGIRPQIPVDIEIVQERHHAINWIVGHEGAPWDEVTTDT